MDLIGQMLNAYTVHEQGKIDARLAASQAQAYAWESAAKLGQQQRAEDSAAKASAMPTWAKVAAGLAVAGLVVYMVKA